MILFESVLKNNLHNYFNKESSIEINQIQKHSDNITPVNLARWRLNPYR